MGAYSPARRPALSSRWGRALAPYLLILPGGGWMFLFFLLPILTLAIMSLQSGDFFNGFVFTWNVGNFSDYEEARRKRLGKEADTPHRISYRKLTR